MIRLGNVVFEDGDRDALFTVATVDGLDGVDYGAETPARPAAFGVFDSPAYGGGRVITWEGLCLTSSGDEFVHARSVLSGLLGDGGSGRFEVEHDGWMVGCDVRRTSRPKFAPLVWGRSARYQVSVFAADPRLYGKQRVFGPASSVTVDHFGNFPAAPVIDVTGSMPSGYTINGPDGKSFVVTQALAAGQTHRIDMATGRLFLNGALTVRGVGRAETWTVAPGQKVAMSMWPVSGAGSMTVSVLDTFI